MRGTLLWKLLFVNLPIICLVVAVVWLAIDYLAADYFSTLMEKYKISPEETHQMFLDAVHRYMLQAAGVAVLIAAALSFWLTRRALKPLSDMGDVSRRIAQGDYGARVEVTSADEVGRLALAFNSMADGLERMEDLRKSMVADLAHELRTPLTNVRGYLEGISDGVVKPTPDTVEMLQAEILRLVRLVEDLHRLSGADAAAAYLSRAPVSLRDLVDQVVTLTKPAFEDKDIRLEIDLSANLPAVDGDRDKLLQVLRNLIDNAWQYTPAGGTCTVVAANQAADGIRFSVTTSGPPIPEDDLPHLFERFYRVDKSRSRDSGGAGIGLAIVKRIVDAHGGEVGAESGSFGNRFWLTLPAVG